MAAVVRFSEAAALALHAAVYLAVLPDDETVSGPVLARICSASEAHMTKVCQRLARAGLLTARRGRLGGFRLARSPRRMRLLDVYQAIEGTVEPHPCLFPNRVCRGSRRGGCVFGKKVLELERQFVGYLKRTTVAEVAAECGPHEKRMSA
jgi:Rrf2 family transcriptional regulator, nitric oxide-sensitive transcriptional repressor